MPKPPSIIGHQSQLDRLMEDVAGGNVSHAYLFSGPRHIGKMTVARWFAEHLILQGIEDDTKEKTRGQVKRLVHPDLLSLDQLWIEKVCEDWNTIAKTSNISQRDREKGKAKTDTISIDDIRALQERLYEKKIGQWRCCLIRSVERMQVPAASAFLKILEEPPEGVVFITTTESEESLLPTVVSRVRVIKFNRLSAGELRPLLAGAADDDARFILHLSQGAPGALIGLRDSPDLLREQRLLHAKAISFWESESMRERLDLLEPLKERGEASKQFLTHLSLAVKERIADTNPLHVSALMELIKGLNTNAHRQLITQKFVLRTFDNWHT